MNDFSAQGRKSSAEQKAALAGEAPHCRNMSNATKVTMAEGISSAPKRVGTHVHGDLVYMLWYENQ